MLFPVVKVVVLFFYDNKDNNGQQFVMITLRLPFDYAQEATQGAI